MKITDLYDKPAVERDANGEVVKACVGLKHRWFYVRPSVMKCTKCGAIKYAPAR